MANSEVSRTAVVTGAGRGIGKAVADRLAASGVNVIRTDIAAGDGVDHVLDVSSYEQWGRVVGAVLAETGSLHILVNNAGIAGRSAPIWDLSVEEWKQVVDIDLSGVFYGCKTVVPAMKKAGWGRIVNVASIAGKEGNPNAVPYSAAKAGVIGLTKAVAKEVVGDGILVNSVTPAVIETPILEQVSDEHRAYMISRIPMGRMGRADEVAALIAWLCSDECSFSTGAVFDVSGGRATY